jgi:hypothetical protein
MFVNVKAGCYNSLDNYSCIMTTFCENMKYSSNQALMQIIQNNQ